MNHLRSSAWAAACVVLLCAHPGEAQSSHGSRAHTRIPVTIAIAESVPGGGPFMILRRANTAPRDMILVRRGVDAAVLSAAVRELLTVRQLQGDTARTSGAVRTRRRSEGEHGRSLQPFPWVQRILDDLRRAPPQEVAGVGRVQAVQIWLPRQQRRGPRGAP
jgi:hypothetical protein